MKRAGVWGTGIQKKSRHSSTCPAAHFLWLWENAWATVPLAVTLHPTGSDGTQPSSLLRTDSAATSSFRFFLGSYYFIHFLIPQFFFLELCDKMNSKCIAQCIHRTFYRIYNLKPLMSTEVLWLVAQPETHFKLSYEYAASYQPSAGSRTRAF